MKIKHARFRVIQGENVLLKIITKLLAIVRHSSFSSTYKTILKKEWKF